MARRAAPTALAATFLTASLLAAGPVLAQQQQEWFVPNQQQPRQQAPAAQQRPAQQPQQRPAQRAVQPNPAPLPPGEPPPAAVIGIVDVPAVQRDSTAFNTVREEIEKRRQKLNDDLQREQARWREEQQQLANQRSTASPEELRNKERDLQERVQDAQRVFRDRSRDIEQAAQQGLQEIEQALATVIRQVAASRKVNLVLPRPLVIYNEPPFDLSPEVTTQLNKILKSVTLPPEGATPAAARPAQDQAPRRN
ncbi:OmpH family outer membrane protein [Teichococcus oryzae]|uniref:OmpH family outer membrane protein n=1 Tax=Teichococcus oryzae TaxID=1608942 RepID=A0A5B2TE03_9PROT|nr:OmpH family outer membrane protein [Pseudoroseomonas oryzae]KAA2212722.1 OmpH family outer membrane protein [Pseudoroseomonas oryzae]